MANLVTYVFFAIFAAVVVFGAIDAYNEIRNKK